MRRLIIGFAAAALMAFSASDASACHKKSCATPCAAPVAVCEPVCAPVKKKCFKLPKFNMPKLGCHKKAACAPVATCNTCTETTYAAPQASYAAPQAAPAAQMLPVPQK